jgi:transposase
MRTRTLSNEERGQIVGIRRAGMKCKDISSVLNIPCSTISTVIMKWRLTGCMVTQKPGHMPRLLTDHALHDLSRELQRDQCQPIAAKARNFNMARNTIRNYIHKLGFGNRIAPTKPYLHVQHKGKRLEFAKAHVYWSGDDWKKVIWADESSFELAKNSRQIRVWRRVNERYHSNCLVPSFKSGRISVMV